MNETTKEMAILCSSGLLFFALLFFVIDRDKQREHELAIEKLRGHTQEVTK